MKTRFLTITTILLLSFCTKAMATFCVDRIYREEKVNLYLCQNHSGFNETRGLLFKGRAKVLNEYIKDKIAKGELTDKRFEIQVYDAILTYQHLELTQGKNGYFVSLSGYASLQELMTIVDYFAKPGWQPFLTGDYQTIGSEMILKQIDRFYEQHTVPTTFGYEPFPVWEKEEVSLEYAGDSLKYVMNHTPLSFQPTCSLPVKIQDRFLFFQADSIFVVQDIQVIKTQKIEDSMYEDFNVYVFPKWVNICWGGEDNWAFSYSYDKNRFSKRNQ